jgi:5'-deoxynucleotidase YfbR-like HD superfamily hydrolase
MAALAHDLPEGYLGDIPAPTKRNLGVNDRIAKMEAELDMEHMLPVFELSELESRLLKLADSLELLQHCVRERQLGNHTPELREMKSNVLEYANEVARTKFEAAAVNMLSNAWEEVR